MNTKGLSGDEIAKYIKMIGMTYQEGRAELAPEVNEIINKTKCVRFNSTSSKITHRVRSKQNHDKPIEYSEYPIHSHVFVDHGDCDYTCECNGCWMYCDGNDRA